MNGMLKKYVANQLELASTPNCKNLTDAAYRLMTRGCDKKGVNKKECLDKYWAKRSW